MRVLIISGLIVSLLMGCSQKQESAKQGATSTEAKKQKTVKVVVSKVQEQTITETQTAFGETLPLKSVDVFSKVNGAVLKKYHHLGELVKAGQVLAVVRQDIPGMEFADHQVKAPLSGMILQDFIEEGATVTIQKPLFNLAQLNPILVQVKVPSERMRLINFDQEIHVVFQALNQRTFKAKFFRRMPQNDLKTRSAMVQLTLPNPDYRLKTNMFAKAIFQLFQRKALTIPVDALVRSGLEYFVFVVKDNIAHKRLVKPGEIFAERIEILSGLSQGERIVVFGQNLLDDGMQVEIEELQ